MIKIGICYRPHLHKEYLDDIKDEIEFIEIMPDIMSMKELIEIKKYAEDNKIKIGTHSLRSNFGGEQIHEKSVTSYTLANYFLNSEYYSDHVSKCYYNDVYLFTVNPIEYTEQTKKNMLYNLNKIGEVIEGKILIENIVQENLFPTSVMTEGKFFCSLLEKLPDKYGVLLDLTNLIVTANNNKLDVSDYINEFPLDKIECIHISGYTVLQNGVLRDTHSNDIQKEQLNYLKPIFLAKEIKYLLIERDFNISCKEDILRDILTLKNFAKKWNSK